MTLVVNMGILHSRNKLLGSYSVSILFRPLEQRSRSYVGNILPTLSIDVLLSSEAQAIR